MARWTFDPLVARNAWFNLGKLGAVADAFGRAFYGEMTDEINAGDRSDRLVVRWDLDPDPAPRSWPEGLPTVLAAEGDPDAPAPCARVRADRRGSRRRGAARARGPPPAGTRRSRHAGARPPPRRSRRASRSGLIAAGLRSGPVRVRAGARGRARDQGPCRSSCSWSSCRSSARSGRASGRCAEKRCILVRVETDDAEGWGECVADTRPDFSGSSTRAPGSSCGTSSRPRCSGPATSTSRASRQAFAAVRGNPMAKAALLDAFVDAELRADGTSLASWLGAERRPRRVRREHRDRAVDRALLDAGGRATSRRATGGSS